MIRLELTDEQARIVARACEFYARIRMGQFKEIIWNCAPNHYVEHPNEAERLWLQLRKHIYPDLQGAGHSYGVGHFPDADTAFDAYQVIDYALGSKREPWSFHDLPKCEKVRDKK